MQLEGTCKIEPSVTLWGHFTWISSRKQREPRGSSHVAQWVKDLVLSLQGLGSLPYTSGMAKKKKQKQKQRV